MAFLSGDEETNVTVVGNVRDVFQDDVDRNYLFVVLDCEGIPIYANCISTNAEMAAVAFRQFVDCRVRINGSSRLATYKFNRAITQKHLNFGSTNDMTIVSRPLADAFAVDEITPTSPLLHELTTTRRRKIRGTVLARWQGSEILVRTASGSFCQIELANQPLPPLHSGIEAVGRPVTDLYHLNLNRAIWRPADDITNALPVPQRIRLAELYSFFGRKIIVTRRHGELLTIRGYVKGTVTNAKGNRQLLIEDEGCSILVDVTETPSLLAQATEGCLVDATGICVLDSQNWSPSDIFPKVRGLFLVTRTADDLHVLRRPPWLTPAKFALILAVMLGVLVLILVWNVSLRVLVERRSREVIRAQEKKLESELRIGERTRLAADLHDSLAQNLTVVAYQVSAAQNALGDKDAATGECLKTAAKMLKSCRTDLRRCLWDLRSDVLDESDFAAAIRRTVEPVAKGCELRIRFDGRREKISDSTAHALLCIVRELVANAANHGQARRIRIAGERRPDGLRLSVRDDGVGFDPQTRPGQTAGHFGLDGIRERLERLGGSLVVESAPGEGTYVRLEIKS